MSCGREDGKNLFGKSVGAAASSFKPKIETVCLVKWEVYLVEEEMMRLLFGEGVVVL